MLHYKRKAFTVVEMVIVIVLIAILAAVAIPMFTGSFNSAEKGKLEEEAKMTYGKFVITADAESAKKPAVYVSDGKYVVFKNRPFKSDGKIYVPYDFIKDVCNADVSIADDSLVLKDGVVYVGIRDFCEANGFELLYCPSPEGVIITTEGETDEAVTEEFFPKDEDEDSQEEEDASEDKDLKEENSEDEICEDKDLKDEDFDNSL